LCSFTAFPSQENLLSSSLVLSALIFSHHLLTLSSSLKSIIFSSLISILSLHSLLSHLLFSLSHLLPDEKGMV